MEFSFSRDLGLPGSNIVANRRPRQAGKQAGRQRSPQHRPLGQRETPSLWLPILTNIKDLAFPFGQFC